MIAYYPNFEYVKLQRYMQRVCRAMNSNDTYKQNEILPEVHKLSNSLVLDNAGNDVYL